MAVCGLSAMYRERGASSQSFPTRCRAARRTRERLVLFPIASTTVPQEVPHVNVKDMQALQLFRRVTQFLERVTPRIAIGDLGPQIDQLKQLADRVAAQAA